MRVGPVHRRPRERRADLPLLMEYFLERYSARYGKAVTGFEGDAVAAMLGYAWPGNIRELQHTIEKAVILSEGNVLKPEDFFMRPVVQGRSSDAEMTLEEMMRDYCV